MANFEKKQQEIAKRHQAQGLLWGKTHRIWAPQPLGQIVQQLSPAPITRHVCVQGRYGA